MPSPHYLGPHSLKRDVTLALDVLAERLSIEQSAGESHSVLFVTGLTHAQSLEATAVYLVAAIAHAIQANLRIRKALFDTNDLHRDLKNDIMSVVAGEDADDNFKTTRRDPWMWEGISHMLVHLSRRDSRFHPSGPVLAKIGLKLDLTDHGFDVIAIYNADEVGISAGECKAYLDNPSRAITDASNVLHEIDENKRDSDLRAAVSQLQSALDDPLQATLAGAFWKRERSYLPFICCDDDRSLDWLQARSVLRRLDVPISRKILYPLPLLHGKGTFDRIARLMHSYAATGSD